MTAYSEFRVRIEPGQRKGQYRVEASGVAGNQVGVFKVPFHPADVENFVLKVGQTRRGVRTLESPQWDMAKTFGGRLFSAVMHGPVAELYRSSYSTAQAAGEGLRVTLSLTDVPELAEIPWEYLYDAPNFLAISTSTPVVRYLDVAKPMRPLEIALPMRILAVVSAPSDAEVLDAGDERARLESALKPLIDANAVSIDWLEVATLSALAKKLQPDTYHILHFIGHGGFDRSSGEGALLFEDASGKGRVVSAEQLATILNDKASLRLVFLNSCEGARTSIKDPFSGVAGSLIEREIPAVIAMQFEITDRAAIIFAGEFYANLAEGQPVDAAVTQARLMVFADDNDVEWGTPVLFLRVEDGRLFKVADASALPRATPEDLPPKVVPPAVLVGDPDPTEADEVAAAGVDATTGQPADAGTEVPIDAVILGAALGPSAIGGAAGAGPTSPPADEALAATPSVGPTARSEPAVGESPGEPRLSTGEATTAPVAPPSGEPPAGEPPATTPPPPTSGGPPTPPPPSPPGGPPSGAPGPVGPGPVTVVGPGTVRAGPAVRSVGIAAIAIIAVVAGLLLLGGGRFPWVSGGGVADVSGSPGPTPTPASSTRISTPEPTTAESSSPPPPTPIPTPPPPIKIAVEVVNLTDSNYRGIIDGVRLAVKDAGGAVNGVPVTVPDSVVFDDGADAARGKAIINKVIADEDVMALVGPYNSSVATAQIPLSNKAGLLQCSPSATSDSLTKPASGAEALRSSRPDAINFVRTVTTNDTDPVGAAIYLIDDLKRQAVYVVDNGAASAIRRGDIFERYWRSRGATVVGRASIPSGVTDYSDIVAQARAGGTDVFYFSGSSGASPTAVRLLKAIREAELASTFMGSGEIFDGTTGRKGSFLNLAGRLAGTGVRMTYPAAGEYAGRAAFEERFEKEYGRVPGLYAITGYACAQAILDALSRTDLSMDRASLRDAVRASAVDSRITYTTPMGDFRFDENGDTTLQLITIYDFDTGDKDWQPVSSIDVPDQ